MNINKNCRVSDPRSYISATQEVARESFNKFRFEQHPNPDIYDSRAVLHQLSNQATRELIAC